MFRKGVLGEAFVIPIALLVTLVSAALFVVAVSTLIHIRSTPSSLESPLVESSFDSRVLLELFLSERFNGMPVRDVLANLPDRSTREADALALEQLFAERYGCTGKNSFVALYLDDGRTDAGSDISSNRVVFSLGSPTRLYSGAGFTAKTLVHDDGRSSLFGTYAVTHPGLSSFRAGSAVVAVDGSISC